MTTLRVLATHPARRFVAAVALLAVAYGGLHWSLLATSYMGSPEQGSRWLSTWLVAGMAVATLCVQLALSTIPRPAAAPRARRTLPRHAKRRGYGAPTLFKGLRGGRAHKRPAASTEDMPSPGRETPPAQLDRTQRLPVTFRVGRAPVGGVR